MLFPVSEEFTVSVAHMQMSLLDGIPEVELGSATPTRTKEEGMRRVGINMNPEWSEFAFRCVSEVASTRSEFTADDIDDQIESYTAAGRPVTHEKRALGVVMTRAARAGLIQPTDRIIPSTRRKLHNSPRRVWQSLILAGQQKDTQCAA
jgi:hypothetical protein